MDSQKGTNGRRAFLKTMFGSAATIAGMGLAGSSADASNYAQDTLQLWSCGGLAEALLPANALFESRAGIRINYTGAFAAALGKSLLGSATTEVFAGRVLDLTKKLRQSGKMTSFKPLCFTSYVLVTPKGNPAGIQKIEDLTRPGVRVVLAPDASAPGGAAVTNILKKAGIYDAVIKNCVTLGSCVQRTMDDVIAAKGDVSIVELRVTRIPQFQGRTEVVTFPEALFPPPPLTFTVGIMKDAKDPRLAADYVDFMTSPEGQAFFEPAGFIPAICEKGQELVEKFGVKDV